MLLKRDSPAPRLRQFNGHLLKGGKEQKSKHKVQCSGECFNGRKAARRATGRLYEARKAECTGLPVRQRASCKRVTCFFFFDYLSGENMNGSMRNEKNRQFLLTLA